MAKVSAAAFAEFLQARVKARDGYIMGATGQDPKTLSAWWFNQYSGNQYTKAIYWKNNAERVWDCNGLAEGYYKDVTGVSINTRARNNYASWCSVKGKGMIPEERRQPGAAVFWGDSEKEITHVAFLVRPVTEGKTDGDWVMVEARGVNYGVVETKLLSRNSAYWGLMTKYFDYVETNQTGTNRRAIVTGSSVNIRSGPGTEYDRLGIVKRGDGLQILTDNGWTPVLYQDKAAWISDKYIRMEE